MWGTFRAVAAVAAADARQRWRAGRLLVVPVLVAYFVKLVTVDSTLVIAGAYTGEPTAAWFAGMTTVIGTTVFFLFGYSLVAGSVERDRETGVGALVASSPVSNAAYLLGKWASNALTLVVMVGVLALSTAVAFLIGGTAGFDAWAFASPFLLIAVPAMGLVAAAAVCFETIGPLRGTLGTAVYFVLALVVFTVGIVPGGPLDVVGLSVVRDSMARSIAAQYPAFDATAVGFAYTDDPGSVDAFRWDGIAWTPARLATRAPIVLATAGLLAVATVLFDRFDDAAGWSLPRLRVRTGGSDADAGSSAGAGVGDAAEPEATTDAIAAGGSTGHSASARRAGTGAADARTGSATSAAPSGSGASDAQSGSDASDAQPESAAPSVDLAPVTRDGVPFGRVALAELRLALRGRPRWWYAACVGAFLATALASVGAVRGVVVPAALLLPLPVWSSLGARERIHRTAELVFVGSAPVRLLAATYASGVAVGLVLTAPAAVRFAAAGLPGALAGWGVGILFLPATALAAGVWTGRPRTFEIAYLMAWYLGPVNGVGVLDYLGTRAATVESGVTAGYLLLTAGALGVAVLGRRFRGAAG